MTEEEIDFAEMKRRIEAFVQTEDGKRFLAEAAEKSRRASQKVLEDARVDRRQLEQTITI